MKQTKIVEEMNLDMQKPVKVTSYSPEHLKKKNEMQQTRISQNGPQGPPGLNGLRDEPSINEEKWYPPADIYGKHATSTKKTETLHTKKPGGRKADRRGIPTQCPKCRRSYESLRKNGIDKRYGQKYFCHACKCSFTTQSGVYLKWRELKIRTKKRLATMRKKGLIK